nr:MlaD family protein [uncultured Porphyromonas sp.]
MKFKKEVQIGLLTVLALVLGYIGINYLKGIEIFKKTTTYYAHFDNLNSVTVATPVIVSGFKVGSVRDVRFDYSRGYGATVEMALDPHVRVSSKSIVKIKMNPLSGSELVLTIDGQDTRILSDGDTISSISPAGDLLSIATDQILPSVNNMMPTITQTLVRLDTLLHDKSIDSVLLALKGSSMQLHAMMAALNQSSQSLKPVMDNVHGMTGNLNAFSAQLTQLKLDSMMQHLNETTRQLQQVTAQLRSKDNTAGLLLSDPSLYNRLDSLVNNADRLMRDLKENPKRYVHFSVF